uniref:Uncharacterized protein n=1 Tax=Trichuris muris TaxID=70415 RepID=A0A5S6QXX4_TRIMR
MKKQESERKKSTKGSSTSSDETKRKKPDGKRRPLSHADVSSKLKGRQETTRSGTPSKGSASSSPAYSVDEQPTTSTRSSPQTVNKGTDSKRSRRKESQMAKSTETSTAVSKRRRTTGRVRSAMIALQSMVKAKASKFGKRLKSKKKQPQKLFDDGDVPMPGFSATLTPKAWDLETSAMGKTTQETATSVVSKKEKKVAGKKRSLKISPVRSQRGALTSTAKQSTVRGSRPKMSETEEFSEASTVNSLMETEEDTDEDDKETHGTKRQVKK